MKTNVKCAICPKGCLLAPNEIGNCRVRKNIDGEIRCTTYGHPCALQVDPIEKKPLFHFLPGTQTLSIATPGCNLHCKQCQNAAISQRGDLPAETFLSPEELTQHALKLGSPSISYTYTEPLVSYEYTYDCCKSAADAGIKNILVTAAYINPDPLKQLCQYVDAANVDLKSFSETFYRDICKAELAPVLTALKIMNQADIFIELTNLLIPTLNDSADETRQLCEWVVTHLGPETPLHFSRFFPQHQLQHLPPTPAETLIRAQEIAQECGLQFVYIGNLPHLEGENTICPSCGNTLIKRRGFTIQQNRLSDGKCPTCETWIHGIWSNRK